MINTSTPNPSSKLDTDALDRGDIQTISLHLDDNPYRNVASLRASMHRRGFRVAVSGAHATIYRPDNYEPKAARPRRPSRALIDTSTVHEAPITVSLKDSGHTSEASLRSSMRARGLRVRKRGDEVTIFDPMGPGPIRTDTPTEVWAELLEHLATSPSHVRVDRRAMGGTGGRGISVSALLDRNRLHYRYVGDTLDIWTPGHGPGDAQVSDLPRLGDRIDDKYIDKIHQFSYETTYWMSDGTWSNLSSIQQHPTDLTYTTTTKGTHP